MKKVKDVLAFFSSLDRGIYPVIVLTAVIESLESFGVLLISSVVLECLTEEADAGDILILIGVLTLAYGVLHLLGMAMARYQNYRILRFYYRYQQYVTGQVLDAPYWRLEKEDFVEVLNQVRQNDQVYGLTISILGKISGIVHTGVSVLVALLSFLRLFGAVRNLRESAFSAAMLVLILFLLIIWSTGYVVWRRKKNTESVVRLTEDLVKKNKISMYLLNEVIARYPVGKHIRLYGMQDRILEEQRKEVSGFAELNVHMNRLERKPGLVGDISSVAISAVIYLTVSAVALGGGFGVGSVIWHAGVVQRLMEAIRQMINLLSEMYSDCARQQVIFELGEMASEEFSDAVSGLEPSTGIVSVDADRDHVLEFQDVSFSYPDSDRLVLEHVNLKLSGRQRVALVGQNGCGKSTLIKLICRLYDPTEGRILLDGVDIRRIPREEYLAFLSVVFQDYEIFAATLGENIALGRKMEELRIQKAVEEVGLGIQNLNMPLRRDLEEKGVEVSGGEGQKIAIARALYKDAPIVILDEPTASLDPISESEIYERFHSLVEGKLALFISHRLSSCRFCDRILVLQSGNIVQDGSHEALSAQSGGLYREMWEAQSRYYI